MNDDIYDYFLILIIGVFGYLVGTFVFSVLLFPFVEIDTINIVGFTSLIPLGIFLGIIVLIFFLSQFKVVRRD